MRECTANKLPFTRVSTLVAGNKYMCIDMVNVLASKLADTDLKDKTLDI